MATGRGEAGGVDIDLRHCCGVILYTSGFSNSLLGVSTSSSGETDLVLTLMRTGFPLDFSREGESGGEDIVFFLVSVLKVGLTLSY